MEAGVHRLEYRFGFHVAKEGNFRLHSSVRVLVVRQRMMSGWIPIPRNSADRFLGGFGLQLSRRVDIRNQGYVDIEDVFPAHVETELPDGFQERQALDVPDRPPDLDHAHIHLVSLGRS